MWIFLAQTWTPPSWGMLTKLNASFSSGPPLSALYRIAFHHSSSVPISVSFTNLEDQTIYSTTVRWDYSDSFEEHY